MKREDFIQAMRAVAHSVTVVTTDGVAGRHGATVSAFCSVSADPPTVLVCLNAASRIGELVKANGVFTVNVLQQGSDAVAKRFAGMDDNQLTDRFDGISITDAAVPEIIGSTVFKCTLEQLVPSGSHTIAIGLVEASTIIEKPPLIYCDGDYQSLQKKTEEA
ncbi:MAG: flavin reductase family protein [Hyphomicrobiales bacterium]